MDFYAGIDFGTSGARIAIIDAEERLLLEASDRFSNPSDQLVDWATIWQETLFQLLKQIPDDYRQGIKAIAINGTSSTVLLCDGAGQSITAPLLYNDARGKAELESLRQFFAGRPSAIASGRDTVLSATSSLVKLLWWQRQPFFAKSKYFCTRRIGWDFCCMVS